ncbi:MAG: restriction endonuclease subunit S [Spirochaetia bacterium]|nr:restriction endonuclease subunit S [Spirochaetia bacterium]MCI6545773.1 restriction endonuclease subunit S [Spirochaetia bacterium]
MEYELGELLPYEQPADYIVESTDYDDSYKTPVLTAGKSFIIGYTNETKGIYTKLPVIIFDDFTTSSQYVDFPFKVKSSAMKILSANSEIADLKYLFYKMQTIQFDSANHKRYWISEYSKIKLDLPTLAEQKRIVNRIETMFAKLDEAKEKAQNVVDSFETRKAAILHKAFTGELTANWRKENEVEKNEELESIHSFVQSLPKKDITNIVEFQKQASDYILSDGTLWKKCFIGAIGIVTNGSTPSRKEPAFWNGDIPWVSSGEVSNNIIEATNECITEEGYNNSSVKKLPIGTVLIAMIGEGKTRGQTSVLNIEATTNQNIAAIVINHGHVEPKFLWYWLQKEYKNNRTAGNGSGPQALNCQRVRELPFILPTLTEQQEIVRILDSILEKESRAKEAAQTVLEQIALLKKSILARAFRGEL